MVEIAKLFLICAVALAASTFVTASLTIEWIEQKLDHFNKSDKRTWKMRYLANDDFYVPDGPLFIYVGGHGSALSYKMDNGLFYDTASKRNAYLFYTEHRYFGESRPVQNFTTESLKYLNVQQALADLAHFIRTLKSSSPKLNDAKVILAGDFYSGSLAIWFKKLYPNLAVGVWASGAPLLAKLNFKEKAEAAGKRIRKLGGATCYNRIAKSINEMEQMLAQERYAELKTKLNLCDTFRANNKKDVAVLFHELFVAIDVHMNIEHSINVHCKELLHDGFKKFKEFLAYPSDNKPCNNITYKNKVASAKDMTFRKNNASPWLYLNCNEFGWFSTTDSVQQPFGTKIPLSFFTEFCKDLFGDKFTLEYIENQIEKTNQLFGGLDPQVKNAYMTYGQFDSWLPLGTTENKATIIPMESDGSDTQSISNEDSKELKAAKNKFISLVNDWLNDK